MFLGGLGGLGLGAAQHQAGVILGLDHRPPAGLGARRVSRPEGRGALPLQGQQSALQVLKRILTDTLYQGRQGQARAPQQASQVAVGDGRQQFLEPLPVLLTDGLARAPAQVLL